MNLNCNISIVVLTYNRADRILSQNGYLSKLINPSVETIIVDNCSEIPVKTILPNSPFIIVRNEKNLGAVGRNKGIEIARGSIIVTLDDDVYGLSDQHLAYLQEMLRQQPDLAAINFRIEEEGTGRLTDWCHPCDPVMGAEREMETNDISEGAVAFRRAALEQVGLYPESFFISHEGPDLAFRLINAGWRIIYSPRVKVIHGYEQTARVSWRRYYYDTRNQLWFVLRNLSFWYGLKRLMTGWGAMMVYSVRDGYSRYWFRAVWHALLGARREWQQRTPPVPGIERRWKEIERDKPGFWVMVRKRLFNREVRI